MGAHGHSKSVSFGGDPGRLFKRVHYRLVNASAEGETLLTALNSLCTQSPSHRVTRTHTPSENTPFSPLLLVPLATCFSWDVWLIVSSLCIQFFLLTWHTHLRLCSITWLGLVFTESKTQSWSLFIDCVRAPFSEHRNTFMVDAFWSLREYCSACYCILRRMCFETEYVWNFNSHYRWEAG